VLTPHRQERAAHVRVANLHVHHVAQKTPGGSAFLLMAGTVRLAADAFGMSITGSSALRLYTFTRMRSLPLPVASMSDRSIGSSMLRFGISISDATGVAQWPNCPMATTTSDGRPRADGLAFAPIGDSTQIVAVRDAEGFAYGVQHHAERRGRAARCPP
jgi:hypothetical protein